jgi:TPR repeat protein
MQIKVGRRQRVTLDILQKTARDDCEKYRQYALGACLYDGIGVPEDKARAVDLFKSSKISDANNALGYHYVKESDSFQAQENSAEATKYADLATRHYKVSADAGDKKGKVNYGKRLEKIRDYEGAIRQYQDCGEHYAPALIALADHSARGVGDKMYEKQAFDYYTKARALDETPVACHRLGDCHKDGFGTKKNPKAALDYYRIFGEREDGEKCYAPSQYELARLYESEVGLDDGGGSQVDGEYVDTKVARLYIAY